ncbi:MAG: hypothetical protein ACM30I_09700 [Gemmatimonas sp.]
MRKQTAAALVAAALVLPSLAAPALADDRHERERYEHRREIERHERFEHRFAERDWDRWHRGHWVRAVHSSREGWWWVTDGGWYYYPAPVYPYPDPYALPVIAGPPPVVTVVPAPAAPQTCREYHGDAIINGTNQPFYGTACLEPDGQWHIVTG